MAMMPCCIAKTVLQTHKSDMRLTLNSQSAETLAFHAERSGSGVGGGVRQPAQVLAHLHPDIAAFAPRRPPRVANNPVRGGGVEANYRDTWVL